MAYLRRVKDDYESAHRGRVWLAWHLAAWTREAGSKGLPNFEKLMGGKAPVRRQSAKEQVAMWQVIAMRFGGKFTPMKTEERRG